MLGEQLQRLQQRFVAAADEDGRLWGFVAFMGATLAFLLLACVTFCRVRRTGGRKTPPRLNLYDDETTELAAAPTRKTKRLSGRGGRARSAREQDGTEEGEGEERLGGGEG